MKCAINTLRKLNVINSRNTSPSSKELKLIYDYFLRMIFQILNDFDFVKDKELLKDMDFQEEMLFLWNN